MHQINKSIYFGRLHILERILFKVLEWVNFLAEQILTSKNFSATAVIYFIQTGNFGRCLQSINCSNLIVTALVTSALCLLLVRPRGEVAHAELSSYGHVELQHPLLAAPRLH